MATKRRPIHSPSSRLNFRAGLNEAKQETRGTKPTSTPTSIKEIFTLMVLHVCKKSLFFDTNLKVGIYLGSLFIVSLISDVAPIPKTYMSRSDNIFNRFFIKYAWGWNLMLLVPFVTFSSYIYCCAQKHRMIKHHISRLVIATLFWWFWTSLFNIIEATYGRCNIKADTFQTKQSCLRVGHYWNGFDISGHAFILIYGSLFLIEESRSMLNWDTIKEHIRLEDHHRTSRDTSVNENPLRSLSEEQFRTLQTNYEKYTPYIRCLFIAITLFQILWDVMLVCTMLYYHIMIEKFLGGVAGIITWFVTYRMWYTQPKILPSLPGEGVFKYVKSKTSNLSINRQRSNSLVNGSVPKFMGRPIYRPEMNDPKAAEDLIR